MQQVCILLWIIHQLFKKVLAPPLKLLSFSFLFYFTISSYFSPPPPVNNIHFHNPIYSQWIKSSPILHFFFLVVDPVSNDNSSYYESKIGCEPRFMLTLQKSFAVLFHRSAFWCWSWCVCVCVCMCTTLITICNIPPSKQRWALMSPITAKICIEL